MTSAAPAAIAATRAVEAVLREHRGRLLAALIARLRDFQLAEDALQEAAISAVGHWGRSGLPSSPQGWLLKVALRKAIDLIRKGQRAERRALDLHAGQTDTPEDPMETPDIPDDRLRLIFTCCHPALEEKSRVALTLRTLCGLTTPEVAAVFLDAEPTMGQRLSRAKAKIAAARIPYAVPGPEDWAARLSSVLTVVYLIYTRGYALGPAGARDLCLEALFLARMLAHLRPDDPEVEGCLALILLTQARAAARIGADGETVPLLDQDAALWDRAMIAEGRAWLDRALARRRPGPFQVKAAIAALHGVDGPRDWPQIAALYGTLLQWEPSPIIRLNQAVALAEGQGAAAGLAAMSALAQDLQAYQPFWAAQAEYLFRAGQADQARSAYDRAIAMTESAADRAFLERRRARLPENPAE